MRTMGIVLVVLAGCFTSATPTSADKKYPFPGAGEGGGTEEQEVFPLQQGGKDIKPVAFDGKRAMKYLQAICDIGPRQSATAGMRKQIELVTKHFEDLGVKVEVQTFSGKQRSRANEVEMKNLVFKFWPERERRVILCSHYDTRPIADQEPDERDWRKPFVSANDGGSGVAFLMEMGNHMKGLKTNVGVDFVLFDGEEFVFDKNDEYFFGSKHFADEYRKQVKNKGKVRYGAAILLDMIGGKDAHFPIEGNSWLKARDLCKQVWGIAAELAAKEFKFREGHTVLDDHIKLQEGNIPAIDIIDFDYAHWHRLSDVPSNCSAESLTDVSKVLSVWLQRVQKKPLSA
jgi:glutaminyl-peptide cyclotransferase